LRCCPIFLERITKKQNICGQKGVQIEYPQGYTSVKCHLKQLKGESSKFSSAVNSFESTGDLSELRCITKDGKKGFWNDRKLRKLV
jgi:hypothetical protein